MTELQIMRARGLKECRLGDASGSREKTFVDHMCGIADRDRHKWLSKAQGDWLEKLAWRYREQLRNNGMGHVVPAQSPFDSDNHYTTEDGRRSAPSLPTN